eukprot:6182767-Pleurochrysis_carterae.AAC.2
MIIALKKNFKNGHSPNAIDSSSACRRYFASSPLSERRRCISRAPAIGHQHLRTLWEIGGLPGHAVAPSARERASVAGEVDRTDTDALYTQRRAYNESVCEIDEEQSLWSWSNFFVYCRLKRRWAGTPFCERLADPPIRSCRRCLSSPRPIVHCLWSVRLLELEIW